MVVGLLFLIAVIVTPQQALAFKLEVTNNQDRTMSFTIVKYEDVEKKWSCIGWYNVPVGTTKTFNFPNSTKGKHFYMHAKAGDKALCCGDEAAHITRTVISNSFKYYDKQQCPDGPNRRSVSLYKMEIDDNVARIEWGEEKPRSQTTNITQDELTAISLLNRDRAENGLPALRADSKLTQVARKHAADMVAHNYLNHKNLQGQSPFDRLKANGIAFRAAAENIAYNYSIESMEEAWMNSPGHRANILNSQYTHVGVGLQTKSDGTIYGVQMFANY